MGKVSFEKRDASRNTKNLRRIKKAGRRFCPLLVGLAHSQGCCVLGLLTGTGSAGWLRLTVSLGNADVAADGVFAKLVDDQLFRDLGAAQIEEDGLVHVAILLFDSAVLGGHGNAVLRALFVD